MFLVKGGAYETGFYFSDSTFVFPACHSSDTSDLLGVRPVSYTHLDVYKRQGLIIHTGSAKDAMVNASLLAMEYHNMLPVEQNPRYTQGYEGFFHLDSIKGRVEEAELHYIIRDHDAAKYDQKKQVMQDIADYLNKKYGEGTFELTIEESYRNMKEKIEPHMHLIDNARKAFAQCGVEAQTVPIRGGTDGARLSYMGLPCPNLSTGGHNFHGRFEYIPVESMDKMTETLVNIVKIYAL